MENKYINISTYEIFINSFQFCIEHIVKFLRFFIYPVLGSFFGGAIAIFPAVIFNSENLEPNALNLTFIAGFMVIGLCLLCHSLWRYIIRSTSSNVIAYHLIEKGELLDFAHADRIITKRTSKFINLLVLQILIALFPFIFFAILFPILTLENKILLVLSIFIFICVFSVFYLYFMLHFALSNVAFALNENFSAVDSIKMSCIMTNGRIFKTFCIFFLLTIILTSIMSLFYIPVIGIVLSLLYYMISPVLTAFVTTYWYLHLKNANRANSPV